MTCGRWLSHGSTGLTFLTTDKGKVCHRVSATDLEMRHWAQGVRARLAHNLPVFTLDFRSHSKLR